MYKASIGSHDVQVVTGKDASVNGVPVDIEFVKSATNSFKMRMNGVEKDADLVKLDKENKLVIVRIEGKKFAVQIKEPVDLMLDKLGINSKSTKKVNNLKAPMPGLVIKILAEQGKHYKAGDALMILEAMKMENVFKAAADVTIKAIEITERQTVEKGQILMVFE
ncbi:MAG: acetyl-CoA carboxylase biotin carboxyl carrier protein subunit [Chitinophagaceae bacterium]|jgi:biotin carboxyl carrier protein|nr:acetyl-CoA carboxylase biotin carboxyl carrier protein subunit [Chitinophagaceae bacterium]